MRIPTDAKRLTQPFQKLGAPDPVSWASSQAAEGINQLGRFLFLRAAWRAVIADGDTEWIDNIITHARRRPGDPCTGAGPALERILAAGASRDDLAELVRVMQYETLFGLCHLLGDPGELEDEVAAYGWALTAVDVDSGRTLGPIEALHESVLELDPTGREMRPATRRS